MNAPICILSTKKLRSNQRQFLTNAGFSVIEADFISISPVAFRLKQRPSLLLFTSQNAVESVLRNEKAEDLKQIPAVCVGTKTRQMLEDNGFSVLACEPYATELKTVIEDSFKQNTIAFFSGNIRSNVLPDAMTRSGIAFEEYTVYKNSERPVKIEAKTDAILFFSPSGVRSYLKKNTLSEQMCFCIGTTTAEALEVPSNRIVTAKQQTVENVIIQCIKHYKK